MAISQIMSLNQTKVLLLYYYIVLFVKIIDCRSNLNAMNDTISLQNTTRRTGVGNTTKSEKYKGKNNHNAYINNK